MTIDDLTSARPRSSDDDRSWLARLLQEEGIDIMEADDTHLSRGTPVYVEGSVPVADVQRRMAKNHIRMLPVLNGTTVVGIVDLVDLALNEGLAPDTPISEAL